MNSLERMMRQQMLYGRRRHRGYGFGRPSGFGRPYGYGWGRPRRRTSVRGCGCCLPIPLGVMTAGALGVRLAAKRARA